MMFYIVAYDIPSDKRRQKVANLLEGYGKRVQYSVFECVLTQAKYNELHQRLKRKIELTEDNVRFYPLSRHTLNQVEILGIGLPLTEFPGSVVI